MADLFAESRPANQETAAELLARLEANGTFIPDDYVTRREYRGEVLKKYAEYIEGKQGQKQ